MVYAVWFPAPDPARQLPETSGGAGSDEVVRDCETGRRRT